MKTVTLLLTIEVEEKKHPIKDLAKFVEFRVCYIPGVVDCTAVESGLISLPVVELPEVGK